MIEFFRSIFENRRIVWSLALHDMRSKYLGSALGVVWIFILPLVNLSIMWFAFEHGLKASVKNGIPFLLWLITGMFPWTFFSEAVSTSTNSILEKPYLVKKVVFNVELLPVVKILASLILFVFLIFIMIAVFLFYGRTPNLYWLQLLYYGFCLFSLVLTISWITSGVVVFYRDLGHLISVGLQMLFWVTPIFWSPDLLPEKYRFITAINPVSYVVTGFRDSLIDGVGVFSRLPETLLFWGIVFVLGFLGLKLFGRLRPHFADVL